LATPLAVIGTGAGFRGDCEKVIRKSGAATVSGPVTVQANQYDDTNTDIPSVYECADDIVARDIKQQCVANPALAATLKHDKHAKADLWEKTKKRCSGQD
jgi:hypothetical protein